jgi:spoIIIJ-associated protein
MLQREAVDVTFLKRLFGGKKEEAQRSGHPIEPVIRETLDGLIEKARFELQYQISFEGEGDQQQLLIELSGADEVDLKDKEGQLIDAIQLFLQRVVQHHFPEDRTNIQIDCGGFREETNQALIDLAEKLKGIVLEKGKSVYCRALPPKDRKIVHQHLAGDERVRSRSVGDGLYKKIKIYPAKQSAEESRAD